MPDKKHRYPSQMRRCVVDVTEDFLESDRDIEVGQALSRGFAICTASMQRAGHFDRKKNPASPLPLTAKGRARQRHFSAKADMNDYDRRYEELLAAAREERSPVRAKRAANGHPHLEVLTAIGAAISLALEAGVTKSQIDHIYREAIKRA
jgi:hypothetical protein